MEALGIKFDETYLASLRETIARNSRHEKTQKPIASWEFDEYHGIAPTSDGTFAFIAGYTPAGAPYGVTWEEWEKLENEREKTMPK